MRVWSAMGMSGGALALATRVLLAPSASADWRDHPEPPAVEPLAASEAAIVRAALPDPSRVRDILLERSWVGLGWRPSETYRLIRRDVGWEAVAVVGDGELVESEDGILVPDAVVDEALAMLARAPLGQGPYEPFRFKTDDHPTLRITLLAGDGEAEWITRSQGIAHVPWALRVEGSEFTVRSDLPQRAFDLLADAMPEALFERLAARARAAAEARRRHEGDPAASVRERAEPRPLIRVDEERRRAQEELARMEEDLRRWCDRNEDRFFRDVDDVRRQMQAWCAEQKPDYHLPDYGEGGGD